MKKEPFENKLEQAAKNGETQKIKELLNEPDAVQVTSSLGAFQPEEAKFFIHQSIHEAQQSCTEGGTSMKRRISIPILVAVVCILCTVGVYAGSKYTHKFFVENDVAGYTIFESTLSKEELDAFENPPPRKEGQGTSFRYTCTYSDVSTPEEVAEKSGITPVNLTYLPEDFGVPTYQVSSWKLAEDSPDPGDGYLPRPDVRIFFYGELGRRIEIKQEVYPEDTPYRKHAFYDVEETGTFTSNNGTEYYTFLVDKYGYDEEAYIYSTIQGMNNIDITFYGLTQEEIKNIINGVE